MKPKVIAGPSLPPLADAELRLRFEVVDQDRLPEAQGLLGIVPDRSMLDRARSLRAVATISAGYDAFDVPELTRRGIALLNCPDALTETTADLAFALALATARRVVELAMLTKFGEWRSDVGEELYGVDVHGKTLGIVGLGRIGSAIARRGALGFGMKVLYTSRNPKPDAEARFGARRRDLGDLLTEADIVCLSVPLAPSTERLIGESELERMKPSAILVNIARGRVVDEQALVRALRTGRILGAGLDVFETEPLPSDSPLLALPNVVALPHVGSATKQTRDAMAMMSVGNLVDYLVLGTPKNVVNLR